MTASNHPCGVTPAGRRPLSERVDWNLLRTFQMIAQEMSFSRAAVRLHLSQPAVTQALKRLEEQIGVALIERNGPRFQLTRAGVETLKIAGEVHGHFGQLQAAVEAASDQVIGPVRLLSVSGIECPAYDRFLAALHRDYPGITLEIEVRSSEAILSALSHKTATFGLAVNRNTYPWLHQQCLTTERYRFYCSDQHPLFGRSDLTLSDLRLEPLIVITGDLLGGNLSPLAEFRDRHSLSGDIVASTADIQEALRLVLAGFGIGCLPDHVCLDSRVAARLWPLPPEEEVCAMDINLLWHADQRLSQAEAVFLQRLRNAPGVVADEQREAAIGQRP